MISLEHNAVTKKELQEIEQFIVDEIGIEYEIDYDSLTIQVLEPEAEEIEKIMFFLIFKGYLIPKRSILERDGVRVYEYCSSDSNHSIYRYYGHYFDVYDGGWCGGEEAFKEKDPEFIKKLEAFYDKGIVGRPRHSW